MTHPVVRQDDLSSGHIIELLKDHRRQMLKHSPPENVHALDTDALRSPKLTFWSAWIAGAFAGCGAMHELDSLHAEIKSMKTCSEHLRRGVGMTILETIINEAQVRGYARLSLETGSMAVFEPARRMYQKFGFVECPPFADYPEDPHSVCMTKWLS